MQNELCEYCGDEFGADGRCLCDGVDRNFDPAKHSTGDLLVDLLWSGVDQLCDDEFAEDYPVLGLVRTFAVAQDGSSSLVFTMLSGDEYVVSITRKAD